MNLTISEIEKSLEKSIRYGGKKPKFVLVLFVAIFVIIGVCASINQNIYAIASIWFCILLLLALVLISSNLAMKVEKSIKNRDFYIITDTIARKKHREETAEDIAEFYFIFEKSGKIRLDDEGNFHSVNPGDKYYVVCCGKSTTARFIYEADKWEISTDDFTFDNGVYRPIK